MYKQGIEYMQYLWWFVYLCFCFSYFQKKLAQQNLEMEAKYGVNSYRSKR